VGLVVEIPLSRKIFLRPALFYFGNGGKLNGESRIFPDSGIYTHIAIKLRYLRLPVDLIYHTKLSKQVDLLSGTGLYIAKGISGTGNGFVAAPAGQAQPFYASFYSTVNFTNDNPVYSQTNVKPYDEGFDLLVGIEWQHVQLIANYSRGIPLIYTFSGYGYRNSVFGLDLTYLFVVKK
jgi:hypothetical protein